MTDGQQTQSVHTSTLLRTMIHRAPPGTFTLEWLINGMPQNSYGVIILFLSLIGFVPVISIPAKLLIALFALQIIFGYKAPVLPDKLTKKPLPTKNLQRLERRVIPALERLEGFCRPRWPVILSHIRITGAVFGLVLTLISLIIPIPFDSMLNFVVMLLALSYIEHDGLLLSLALALGCGMFATLFWII